MLQQYLRNVDYVTLIYNGPGENFVTNRKQYALIPESKSHFSKKNPRNIISLSRRCIDVDNATNT